MDDEKWNWNVSGEEWEVEKYDDPSDDKQIYQRTWEGKNLDGEIGKLSKYFMIPPTYQYHGRTNLKRNELN